MPKEQINYPTAPRNLVSDEFPYVKDPTLHVGWDKTGWVQVGMEVDIGYAQFAISNPNGATHDRTRMWTPVLSPTEINAMINTLRKALRKAYGRPTSPY